MGWCGLDWSQEGDNLRALVNAVMNIWAPLSAGKLSSGKTTNGLSSCAQLHKVSYLVN
jgi:hypothetical protein